jgi:hypothetical protein
MCIRSSKRNGYVDGRVESSAPLVFILAAMLLESCRAQPNLAVAPEPAGKTPQAPRQTQKWLVSLILPRWSERLRKRNVGRHLPLVFRKSFPEMGGEQLIFDPHTNLGARHKDQE